MGLILGLAAAAVAVAGVWLYRSRQTAKETVPCHARCPSCAQKVRFPADQAGRAVKCARCRQRFVLPAEAQPTPANAVREKVVVGRRITARSSR